MKSNRLLLVTCFVCYLPLTVFAEAPVVDESENYALLDEPATMEQPFVTQNEINDQEQPAFARENIDIIGNNDNNVGLLKTMQGLQQAVQELRGQLEIQARDLKLLQQQQLDFYKDLDVRLRPEQIKSDEDSSSRTNTTIGSSINVSTTTPLDRGTAVQPVINVIKNNPADEQISYLAAYELVKNKRFEEALTAMQTFVTKYPKGGYTANAQYWLGELYMVKKNHVQAIEHFDAVLQQFPSSSKTSASMLKVGYALAASGKVDEARQRLEQVLKKYPDTNMAQLAKAKLKSLGFG